MKCQIRFSGKNKKNISKCRLLKILPRVLSVKAPSGFPTDHSKAVPPLQFFCFYAFAVSYETFVLSLFVRQLSFFLVPQEGCLS